MSMSKQIKSSSNEQAGYGFGYVFDEYQRDYMKGRLCTILESFGLRDGQEKAAKDIIKQEVDAWFYPNALGINGSLNTAIHAIVHRIHSHYQESGSNQPTPVGGYGFEFEIVATEKAQ